MPRSLFAWRSECRRQRPALPASCGAMGAPVDLAQQENRVGLDDHAVGCGQLRRHTHRHRCLVGAIASVRGSPKQPGGRQGPTLSLACAATWPWAVLTEVAASMRPARRCQRCSRCVCSATRRATTGSPAKAPLRSRAGVCRYMSEFKTCRYQSTAVPQLGRWRRPHRLL